VIGEIGTLNQGGKQVGGFRDWQIDLTTDNIPRRGYFDKKVKIRLQADRYWLLDKPAGDNYTAKFYQHISGQLALVAEHDVNISLEYSKGYFKSLSEMVWITK